MKILKKIFPFFIISIFVVFIVNYYQNHKNDFLFLNNISFINIFTIIILCFFYLITETVILKKIIKFYDKKSKFNDCFLVICTTYLCNTFIQFSGLGYRAYYLKKNKNIDINKFILLSLFIILVELLIFALLSFIFLIIFDILNKDIKIYSFIYTFLTCIICASLISIFYNRKIINFLLKFNFITNIKFISFILNYFLSFDLKKFKLFFFKFIYLFILQFIILFIIFLMCTGVLELNNSILFSLIVTMSTDLSFVFTITPYAIGISETFIFFSSNNFDIKLSEILYITNIFRLSMFLVYSFFGFINLYWFSKKII
jgi:uncharacterized membrane protein YbhN (UPF0104 family)